MTPRPITSIIINVIEATRAKMSNAQYIAAHEAARDLHGALADAMEAETDLAHFKAQGLTAADDYDVELSEKKYQDALGRGAVAFQKVPVKWLAVLGIPIDGGNVVPFKTAAE